MGSGEDASQNNTSDNIHVSTDEDFVVGDSSYSALAGEDWIFYYKCSISGCEHQKYPSTRNPSSPPICGKHRLKMELIPNESN